MSREVRFGLTMLGLLAAGPLATALYITDRCAGLSLMRGSVADAGPEAEEATTPKMPAGRVEAGRSAADATPPVQVSAQEQASQEEFVRDHDRDGARRDVGGPSMAVPPAEDVPEHAADGLAHEEVPLDRYDAGHALGADAAAIEAPQALAEPETPNAGRFAEPSERTQQEGQEIQKVAATASDPFQAMQASDLPAEPCRRSARPGGRGRTRTAGRDAAGRRATSRGPGAYACRAARSALRAKSNA